jgi:H+-translocating NAD(P) transhydrogenase subunit alpha
MGAKSIDLDLDTLEGAGGYAREMTEDRAARQRELLSPYVAAADALITTAAVPGRRAPMLVTSAMVAQMKAGSIVVDLAADSGGNVEGAVAGSVVTIGRAQVWGGSNVPSQLPAPASRLFAQNVVNVITLMTAEGQFAPDFADEIVAGMCLIHGGDIVHEATAAAALQPAPAPPPVEHAQETSA